MVNLTSSRLLPTVTACPHTSSSPSRLSAVSPFRKQTAHRQVGTLLRFHKEDMEAVEAEARKRCPVFQLADAKPLSAPTQSQVYCLGLSHHTAPVEIRERLSFGATRAEEALLVQREAGEIHELAILSTCNRLEVYAAFQEVSEAAAFERLIRFLEESSGMAAGEFEAYLYSFRGMDVAWHLCHVASGLDSMVLGETEILGQVTSAYEATVAAKASGHLLKALFRTAIRAGKRARTETAISLKPVSVSSVAVDLARKKVGRFAHKRILLLGAGKMAQAAYHGLLVQGATEISVANRSRSTAETLAKGANGRYVPLHELEDALVEAELVFACTSAPGLVVTQEMMERVVEKTGEQPRVLVDIAVPRDICSTVRGLPGVTLLDVDDLQCQVRESVAQRRGEIPRVETMIGQEMEKFSEWLRESAVLPTIAELRQNAEALRKAELSRLMRRLPEMDDRSAELVEELTRSLVNKLLHHPVVRLRKEARKDSAEDYNQAIRYLFALSESS